MSAKLLRDHLSSDEDSAEINPVETIATHKSPPVSPWTHFYAGGIAGMMGALFTAPLDVVKTRLQSDIYSDLTAAKRQGNIVKKGYYHVVDTFNIVGQLYTQEGFRSLFKGLGPNLAGVVPARSVNFFTYGLAKEFITSNGLSAESSLTHLGSGICAGIVTSTVTNPIWLVKTRLQLDKQVAREYKGSLDCTKKIIKNEGFRALYRGLSASYLGTIESSIQWVLYEQMKLFIARAEKRRLALGHEIQASDKVLNWCATSGAAGAAKFAASLLTYPHEVVRTRLRQAPSAADGQPKYRGLVHCFKLIIKEEGFASMYGGLTPHLLRTVPNSIIMFGTWDLIVRLVQSWQQ